MALHFTSGLALLMNMCDKSITSGANRLLALVSFPFFVAFFAAIGFAFGCPVSKFHAIAALVATCLLVLLCEQKNMRKWTLIVFGGVLSLAVLLAALPVMYTTTDGMNCHRIGVFLFANGWNPLRTTEMGQIAELVSQYCPSEAFGCFRDHLAFVPKGAWIFGASLYKIFGFVEVADAYNIYAILTLAVIVNDWFSARFAFRRWTRRICTMVFCFCPYVIGGLFGGAADASLYCFVLIALFSADLYLVRQEWERLASFAAALTLSSGIKFGGILFGVVMPVILIGYSIYTLLRWRKGWSGFVAAAVTLILVFALNPSPYLTSWVNHSSPFYPAHSFSKTEKVSNRLSYDFDLGNEDARAMGYWGRFSYAYLSKSLTKKYYAYKLDRPSFDPKMLLFDDVDGLGMVYRVFFVLSLIGVFFVKDRGIQILVAVLGLSIFLQPATYMGYGRYVSHIYAIPPLVAIGLAARWNNLRVLVGTMILLGGYAIVQVIKPCQFMPYMWLISVQNLCVLNAAETERVASIETDNFYSYLVWKFDLATPHPIVARSMLELGPELSYGPCNGRYRLCLNRQLSGFPNFQCAPVNDADAIRNKTFSSQRRAGIERYFLKEFLPHELLRLPLRVWQVFKLRFRQFCRNWITSS